MAASRLISIQPGVGMYAVLPHLNYRPWFAMAEFVDNSLQSYLANEARLRKAQGPGYQLKVRIKVDARDGGSITINDNAAGIADADYVRAFRPAEIPLDTTGLSEFGMGMKSAACWFSKHWSVRSAALDEGVERFVDFDVEKVVKEQITALPATSISVKSSVHYTELTLRELYNQPHPQTIAAVKAHLASIYRIFLRDGVMTIEFDDVPLSYETPAVLEAPFFRNPAERARVWKKQIDIDLGSGRKVRGMAALRATGSVAKSGFALFRRRRLIAGSEEEGYRPPDIFKQSNSYTYQRLFGELEVEGFPVSHTKDGFLWGDNELRLVSALKAQLDKAPLPMLQQAEGYRVRARPADLRTGAEPALESTAEAIEKGAPPILDQQVHSQQEPAVPEALPVTPTTLSRDFVLQLEGRRWRVRLEGTDDASTTSWLQVGDAPVGGGKERLLTIQVSLVHPFMVRFAGVDPEKIEPIVRIAAALALAETTARESGIKKAGTIRLYVNQLLRDALSTP